MHQANKLIVNTLVTYCRMALTVGLGLVSIRLALSTLGDISFGLFTLLGGSLSMLMLVKEALTASVQRHLAHEIGRKDERALREVFCTSAAIYLVLGSLLVVIGLVTRAPLLGSLTIPEDRLEAARWVFNLGLVTMASSVITTPFMAVFQARQAMVQDAFFDILGSVAALLAIVLTPRIGGDLLITYAALTTISRLTLLCLQIARGLFFFPEARLHPRYFEPRLIRELLSFAGWTFLGRMAISLRAHGSNIILNLYFGPVINASYSVGVQACHYMGSFAGTITRAVQPAMSTLEGAGGQRARVQQLALTSSKLTVLACSFVAVPLALDPGQILLLWIGRTPPYAESFICLMMIWITLDRFRMGHELALVAVGSIGRVTRHSVWIILSTLPLSAAVFHFTELPPPWTVVLAIMASVVTVALYVVSAGSLIGLPVRTWAKQVLLRVLLSVAPGIAISALLASLLPATLYRPVALGVANAAITTLTSWFTLLTEAERSRFRSFYSSVRRRIQRR